MWMASTTGPLTFTFLFNHEETPNNPTPPDTCPYPTPPGEGCTDRVTFVSSPQPTTFNVGGVDYTLSMSFLDNGDPVSEFITREGGTINTAGLIGQFTVAPIPPDTPVLTLTKSGPATMNVGQPGDFTLDIQNTGTGDAWDALIRDVLPDGATGGMCDLTPQILGVTLAGSPLVQGTHYTLSYTGPPTCELTLRLLDGAGPIAPGEHLIVSYRTQLDANTQNGATLTNIAGATEWFDDDSSNPSRVAFTRTLTDGTPGVLDHEDAHTVTGQINNPSLFASKSVALLTDAGTPNVVDPGDVLRYTISVHNSGGVPATGVTLTDTVPANTSYEANSTTLNGIAVPDGVGFPLAAGLPISSSDLTPPLPGAGAGTISAGGTAVITFELRVDDGVPGGTIISNQGVVGSTGVSESADRRRRQSRHRPGADGGHRGRRPAADDHQAGRGGRRRGSAPRGHARVHRHRPERRAGAGLRRRDHGRSGRSDAGPARVRRPLGDAERLRDRRHA